MKSGFLSSAGKSATKGLSEEQLDKFLDRLSDSDAEKYVDEEDIEVGKDAMRRTGYPVPILRYRMAYETHKKSIEELYYWLLNYVRYDLGFPIFIKITDVFAAAEHSAFFGVAQQRLGLQQEKVTTVGKEIVGVNPLRQSFRERLATLEQQLKESEGRATALVARVQRERERMLVLREKGFTLTELRENVENLRQIYDLYAKKQEEARMSSVMDKEKLLNVSIVDHAGLPIRMQEGTMGLAILLAFMAGPATGVGAALGLEFLNRSFRFEEEVESYLALPVLATIPDLRLQPRV